KTCSTTDTTVSATARISNILYGAKTPANRRMAGQKALGVRPGSVVSATSTLSAMAHLGLHNLLIYAAGSEELIVGAGIHDPAVLQYQNMVGIVDGGNALCHNQHGRIQKVPG